MKLRELVRMLILDDPEGEVRFAIDIVEPGGRSVRYDSIDPPDAYREVPNPHQYITKPDQT